MSLLPEPRAALARLARRSAVRLAREASKASGTPFLLVGGAVRDALLGLPPGDLDLAVPRDGAAAFAAALARLAGTRVVPIGRAPRRILHVPLRRSSVDVWETDGDPADDLLRRDFTVNALALAFPGARLVSPAGALDDLAARLLRLPRAGVLLEDPLRVVRAARFLARLPGFRLDPGTLPELAAAARSLDAVAPERRLAELDEVLAAGPAPAARALGQLEAWGGLAALLPGIGAAERRLGLAALAAVRRDAPPALLRALLLSGAPPERAAPALDALRASRSDRRLAATLAGLPPPSARPDATEAIRLLRRAAPFSSEAIAFVEATGGRNGRALARLADAALATPGALGRLLNPRRPVAVTEVATILGVAGPELGHALERLDDALATGAVRGAGQARAFLSGRPRPAAARGRRECLPV
ncbi:MAG: tRNA nucleotidyltransferase/poly(A) polymerase family protein [Thermoanaerobaculia bacterium]